MIARLAVLAAAALLPLSGTAYQLVAPIAIYVDEAASSLVERDYTVTVDEMRVPVTTVSRGPQPLSAIGTAAKSSGSPCSVRASCSSGQCSAH